MNSSNEKIFGLLTICRKAGKMVMGFDSVKEALQLHKAKAVLVASDLSAKSEKEVRFFAEKNNTPVIKISSSISEIEFGLGKKVGIIGICDEGFAAKITELTAE